MDYKHGLILTLLATSVSAVPCVTSVPDCVFYTPQCLTPFCNAAGECDSGTYQANDTSCPVAIDDTSRPGECCDGRCLANGCPTPLPTPPPPDPTPTPPPTGSCATNCSTYSCPA